VTTTDRTYFLTDALLAALAAAVLTPDGRQALHHGSHSVPGQPGMHFVHVGWYDWQARERFEAQPGVLILGDLWDPVPAAAIPLLNALQATRDAVPGAPTVPSVRVGASDTVAQALRKAAPHLRLV
jgi:hypothetical protein